MQAVLTELLSFNCRQRIFKYPQDPSFWSLNTSDYCEDWCINIGICFFESQKSKIHVCLFEIQTQTIYIRMQSFLRRNREESTHPSLQLDSNLLFVGFAYMFKGNLKNARNKFADVIL